MLLNLTNHPSVNWPKEQIKVAKNQFGEIQDLPFPKINPIWEEADLDELVKKYKAKIQALNPAAVHIMGEMTFTYRLVNQLKENGIPCIASTTERKVMEEANGSKTSQFNFVNFRSY